MRARKEMDEVEMKEAAPLSFLNYCKCDNSIS
jgi:hypothetical protein